jgi:inward rectifier potassium channel
MQTLACSVGMPPRTRVLNTGLSYGFSIIDDQPIDWRDSYHWLLRLSWPRFIGVLVALFLGVNALFATLYFVSGGVTDGAHGSWLDCFFFSVQTFGTIGYGSLHPVTLAANALVVLESFTSMLATALMTGLVFVRFSHARARVRFSQKACISLVDGIPHLMVRIGNQRSNRIFDTEFRLTLVRTVRTAEGTVMYKNEDLRLVRSQAPSLLSSFAIMHLIDETSPFWESTPASLKAVDAELQVAVSGTDETTLQPVHGRHTWEASSIVFGERLADVVQETPNGDVVVDLRNFNVTMSVEPIRWNR